MTNVALTKSIELLKQASSAIGFLAAVDEEDNYRRVWARDSAMCGLASLATDDADLLHTFRLSIETILKHQHPAGFIPSNVSADEKSISYGGSVGRVDNHAWIIISACNYAHATNNIDWLLQYETHFDKCFNLMAAWEFNAKGLMYVPQSADWADEYHHHGYILFNQLLRLWSLRCATKLFKNKKWIEERSRIEAAITIYYCANDTYYSPQNKRQLEHAVQSYWVMGFNTSQAYTQFDLQANALGLLLKIGTSEQQQNVVTYIRDLYSEKGFIIPSFYPTIEKDNSAFSDLENNYAFRFRNLPNEFHNGGLWSVWNGLAALAVSDYDAQLSDKIAAGIADACAQNDWEFNECHHGLTHKPIGVKKCAWSAAGLLLSFQSPSSTILF